MSQKKKKAVFDGHNPSFPATLDAAGQRRGLLDVWQRFDSDWELASAPTRAKKNSSSPLALDDVDHYTAELSKAEHEHARRKAEGDIEQVGEFEDDSDDGSDIGDEHPTIEMARPSEFLDAHEEIAIPTYDAVMSAFESEDFEAAHRLAQLYLTKDPDNEDVIVVSMECQDEIKRRA